MIPPGMLAALVWRLATPGDSQWVVAPAAPTVGDTIWLVRVVTLAPEWRLKPGPFENQGDVAPLGDPWLALGIGGDTVRYPVVAWTAGAHHFRLPTLWLVGAGGRSDSLPGGAADVTVRSVLPADGTRPSPKALLPPLDSGPASPWPPLIAAILGMVGLVAGIRLRRLGPRPTQAAADFVTAGGAPDDRWLAAGEPKAVAARATRVLRQALARAVPEAQEFVPVREALEAAEGRMPGATFRRVREALLALEQVSYAVAHGTDVQRVASEARELAREL
ncbi:MAG TPA: hypothetical protein VNX15_01150 [Gemmatimonadales bacterium]|jgi:hypothetical protein|nr:hypothetical protein [Gemmatimonadales bacterium]